MYRFIFLCFLAAWLSACDTLPNMSMLGPDYAPIDAEVAVLAAPGPVDGGSPLYCRIGNGTAHFGSDWLDLQTADFLLQPGQRAIVTLGSKKTSHVLEIMAYFDPAGQKMIFCPQTGGPPGSKVSCSSLYALESDLKDGIKRTFDVPEAVRGAGITCGYGKNVLRKLP